MKAAGLKITVKGTIANFLGVNIKTDKHGHIHLMQPQLIDSILKELNLDGEKIKGKLTLVATSKLLHSHANAPPHDGHFHYQRVIGKLKYLEKCTRLDIAFAAHQCARFSADPQKPHADAIKWICCYLKATQDKGSSDPPAPHLTSMLMQTLLATGTGTTWNTLTPLGVDTATSSCMPAAHFTGHPSCRPKLTIYRQHERGLTRTLNP